MPLDIFQATTTEMFILLFLSKEDAHGYQLAQMLTEHSSGLLCVKATSLYPLLYKLEEKGYISGRTSVVERKSGLRPGKSARVRIVYHIEKAGFERLKILREEHEVLVKGCATVFDSIGMEGEANEKSN